MVHDRVELRNGQQPKRAFGIDLGEFKESAHKIRGEVVKPGGVYSLQMRTTDIEVLALGRFELRERDSERRRPSGAG